MAEELIQPTPTVRGTSILEQLGVNPQDVLSAQNIQETLTAPQAPVNDALGIFTQQEASLGVPQLQQTFQEAQRKFLAGQNLANQEQLTIEGRAKKLGVLRGEQAQAASQASQDLGVLQTGVSLAQSALQSAQETARQRGNILYQDYQKKVDLNLQFPGLGINPITDDFAQVSSKLQKFKKDEEKKAEKNAYKEALRSMGLKTTGSRKELEKRLIKANKTAASDIKKENELKLRALDLQVREAEKKLSETKTAAQIEQERQDALDAAFNTKFSQTGGQSTVSSSNNGLNYLNLIYNKK